MIEATYFSKHIHQSFATAQWSTCTMKLNLIFWCHPIIQTFQFEQSSHLPILLDSHHRCFIYAFNGIGKTQASKTFWIEVLFNKNFPLDYQTRQTKRQFIKVINVDGSAKNVTNVQTFPDCPSSVQCSWWVAPLLQVLNLKNQHWGCAPGMSWVERWDAFPASSFVCAHNRVWSHGPVRQLQSVR